MRNENSHKSELISQLLYGDCFKVISKKDEWLKITTLTDQYSGWIDYKQTQLITKSEAEDISFKINSYSSSLVDYIEASENKLISLVLGSNIGAAKFLNLPEKLIISLEFFVLDTDIISYKSQNVIIDDIL